MEELAPANSGRRFIKWGVLIVLVIVLIIGAILVTPRLTYKAATLQPAVGRTCPDEPNCKPTGELAGAQVKYNSSGIKVTNTSPDDWSSCSYDINGFGGYYINNGSVKSGASVSLRYKDFTNFNGVRLNTNVYKQQTIGVSCDLTNGDYQASDFALGS